MSGRFIHAKSVLCWQSLSLIYTHVEEIFILVVHVISHLVRVLHVNS